MKTKRNLKAAVMLTAVAMAGNAVAQTTNYVPKWSGSAYVNTVTPIFEDATNSKIGIGTTTPGAKLEVFNTSGDKQLRLSTNDGDGPYHTDFTTLYGGSMVIQPNDTSHFVGIGNYNLAGGQVPLRQLNVQGGAPQMRLTYTKGTGTATYTDFQTTSAGNLNITPSGGRVGIGTTTPGYKLDVQGGDINASGSVRAAGVVLTSDRTFKTNIEGINNALSIIAQLKPSSYFWDTKNPYGMNFESQKQYGFISQEVEITMPELIYNTAKPATYDEKGVELTKAITYKGLNYNAFIPIVTKAVQEQQAIIENLKSQLKDCLDKINAMSNSTSSISDAASNAISSATLFQNNPNPFSQQTSIQYMVPATSQHASIMIFDLQGKLVKTLAVSNFGSSSITINGNELSAGMFVYSLVVDGKIVDTKRMILTQ